jgi:hypothetical protein
MLGFRKVRYANIPTPHRDIFERYGESVIQLMIAASHTPRAGDLSKMYADQPMIENAAMWLTEQADKKANHEWRIEIVEWSILVFVVVGVVMDIILVRQGVGH